MRAWGVLKNGYIHEADNDDLVDENVAQHYFGDFYNQYDHPTEEEIEE